MMIPPLSKLTPLADAMEAAEILVCHLQYRTGLTDANRLLVECLVKLGEVERIYESRVENYRSRK